MKFFQNKRNIFITLIVGILFVWGMSYTNCGSDLSNENQISQESDQVNNTNALKQPGQVSATPQAPCTPGVSYASNSSSCTVVTQQCNVYTGTPSSIYSVSTNSSVPCCQLNNSSNNGAGECVVNVTDMDSGHVKATTR